MIHSISGISALESGQSKLFFTSGGDFSFMDVASEIFEKRPKNADIVFCTWRIGKLDISKVAEMAQMQGVSMRLVVDASMQTVSRRGEWDIMLEKIGAMVWLTKNHAKIFAMNPDWVVITSANLNRNERLEVFYVARDKEAYSSVLNGLSGVFSQKAAIDNSDRAEINSKFIDIAKGDSFAKIEKIRQVNPPMELMTQVAYAKHRGVSQQRISALIKRGSIPPDALVKDGARKKIDRDKADRALDGALDPAQNVNSKQKLPPQRLLDAAEGVTYERARTAQIMYRAELDKVKLEAERGELVRIDDVRKDAYDAGQEVRRSLSGIADRWAPILAAETEAGEVQRILDAEVNAVLADLADGLEKYAGKK